VPYALDFVRSDLQSRQGNFMH